MNAEAILFYIIAALVLALGAGCVFSRSIFRSATYLLFSLIGVAGIYVMMDMNFVAALQIMIYVGGIVVLIIFSIFLTHNTGAKLPLPIPRRMFWALFLPATGFMLVLWILMHHPFRTEQISDKGLDIQEIGHQLFNMNAYGYIFPFEMVSVLLLAALIGSIVIAQHEKKRQG